MRPTHGAGVRRPALGSVLAAAAVVVGACSSSASTVRHRATPHAAAPATTVPTAAASATTSAPTTTDPGALPQTMARPSAQDPLFEEHVQALWRAVVDGNPSEAMGFFFPLSAYVQVKAISDPVHDWQTRLVADFDADVLADHADLGSGAPGAVFGAITVPPDAVWVQPGVEYNKGSYWRVYGSTVHYTVSGQSGSFVIASMISWRGEWYVVHLARIR